MLHPGLGNKLLLIFIFLYRTQGIIYEESHIPLVHGQRTELQSGKLQAAEPWGCRQQSWGRDSTAGVNPHRKICCWWGKARFWVAPLLPALPLERGRWKTSRMCHHPRPRTNRAAQNAREPPCRGHSACPGHQPSLGTPGSAVMGRAGPPGVGSRRQNMHLHRDRVIARGRYQTGLCMHNYPICIGDNCLGESGTQAGCYPGLVRLLI